MAGNFNAALAADLDLVNLRGFTFGMIAKAIQHMATVLESGLQLSSPDLMYTLNPVNSKYAKRYVEPVCVGGRTEAQLPTEFSAPGTEQEDLVVERCRQLIYGTQAAAKDNLKQYKECLQLLAKLLKYNYRPGSR